MARDIKIRITGDSSGLKSAFGEAEGRVGKFGSVVTGIFQGIGQGIARGVGGLLGQVPSLIGDSIAAASNFNETVSKSQVIFGEGAAAIRAWADDAARNFGQSRQQALDAASTFATFGKAAGFSGDDLVGFSKNLTELGSDFASFYDSEPQVAIEAIGAALRGESEPIRQFGVLLNEDALKATALSKGLVKAQVDTKKLSKTQEAAEKAARKTADALKTYGKDSIQYSDAVRDQQQAEMDLAEALDGKVPSLTQAQKVQAAYHAILEQSTDAQGDFARTSDGLANTQRTLSSQFADLSQDLGEVFLPVALKVSRFLLDEVVPALRGVIDWVKDVAETVRTSGWAEAFKQVVDQAAEKIGELAGRAWDFLSANLPGWLSAFGDWFANTAAPWMGERAKDLGLKIADLAGFAWDYLKERLPIWLQAFGQWFTETAVPWVIEKAESVARAMAEWVPKAWDATVTKLKEYLKKLEDWFNQDASKTSEEGGGSMVEAFMRGLGKLWFETNKVLFEWQVNLSLWFFTVGVPAVAKGMAELWVQAAKTMAAAQANMFKAGFEIGKDIIAGIIDGIWSAAGELASNVKAAINFGIPDTARKLLGISSPSKVMMKIGGEIAEGLAVGIEGGAKRVAFATQAMIDPAMSGFPQIPFMRDGQVVPLPGAVSAPPARATSSTLVSATGLGGSAGNGSVSLTTAASVGAGTLTINVNGAIGNPMDLARMLSELLRRYGTAVG